MRLTAATTAAAASLSLAGSAAAWNCSTPGEVPYIRSYFYAGGQYADDGNGGKIFRDQMYVEKLLPTGGVKQRTPVVLIHGQAQTGSNFLNKPDGGRGWASQFIRQGYEVYIVDQTLRARSAWQPKHGAAAPSTYSAELLQQRFTAVQNYKLWPQSVNHTQWPGAGVMGDPVFDAFYASNVQFVNNATLQQSTMAAAGAALLDRIGRPAVLVGHSQGGVLPLLIADARPSLAAALVLLEPTGPPFREAVFSTKAARPYGLTDAPLAFDPPVSNPAADLVQKARPARNSTRGVPGASAECVLQADSPPPRRLANLADKNVLIMTGEASYHMPYDYCTAAFLKQAGVSKTEHFELADKGIHGNGHMFFMERNSDQIQALLHDWIQRLN